MASEKLGYLSTILPLDFSEIFNISRNYWVAKLLGREIILSRMCRHQISKSQTTKVTDFFLLRAVNLRKFWFSWKLFGVVSNGVAIAILFNLFLKVSLEFSEKQQNTRTK